MVLARYYEESNRNGGFYLGNDDNPHQLYEMRSTLRLEDQIPLGLPECGAGKVWSGASISPSMTKLMFSSTIYSRKGNGSN